MNFKKLSFLLKGSVHITKSEWLIESINQGSMDIYTDNGKIAVTLIKRYDEHEWLQILLNITTGHLEVFGVSRNELGTDYEADKVYVAEHMQSAGVTDYSVSLIMEELDKGEAS